MKREKTRQETIIATNNDNVSLCSPRYGCNWTITKPLGDGMETCYYIGDEHSIRAMFNAHYATK